MDPLAAAVSADTVIDTGYKPSAQDAAGDPASHDVERCSKSRNGIYRSQPNAVAARTRSEGY